MNIWRRRILCMLLAACMVLQTTAWAAEETEATEASEVAETETAPEARAETEPVETMPETEPAPQPVEAEEPDPLEGYTFPDNWAREALMFAVRNGILQGKGDHNLDPTGKTSRVEMAAMLVRLLGAAEAGDLSQYQDLNPNAWYYRELGTAVNMGIFNGVSETAMAPTRSITRQEAFTVLARAFGLRPRDQQAYQRFRDAADVKPFARDAVSALVEVGCVSGYENGTLKPKATITRQEVAALFYKLLDQICDDPAELPESGFVLYRGSEAVPEDYQLDGSLILGAGLSGQQTVSGLQVSDRLILRCASQTEMVLENVTAPELSVASTMTVWGGGTFQYLVSAGQDAQVELDAAHLEVFSGGAFFGNYEDVAVHCDGAVLHGDAAAMNVTAAGTVTVHGTVGEILLTGTGITLRGSGYADTVTVRSRHCVVELACGRQVDEVDWGLEGLKVRVTGTEKITPSSPKATLTATFSNFTAGYGCSDGARTCRLQWYLNGTLLETQESFVLREGAAAVYGKTFDTGDWPKEDLVFTVVLTCGEESVQEKFTVKVEAGDYETALRTVQTVNVEAETLRDTVLYEDRAMSRVIRSVAKGTKLTHLYYSDAAGEPGQVRMADGTVGWMPWSDYLVSRTNYTQFSDYSTATKEGFVDQKGYSSPTSYLLWISLKTQKVNIFQGSKGNWKLIRTCPCATGNNITPTVTGVFSVIYKTYRWRFSGTVGGEYVDDYSRVYYVTGFWGGQAFHSRLYDSSDDSVMDGTIGTPASHGCVRMYDEDCQYIYDNMPYDTTVVVF